MKRVFSILMILTLLFSLAACSNNGANEESSSPTQQSSNQSSIHAEGSNSQNDSSEPTESSEQNASSIPTETAAKSLVVYFSWSGNTENVAKSIQRQTDFDIWEIIPVTPYSDDYDAVVDLAQKEQSTDARPAISGSIENIEQYDVIYVGYPNWWYVAPTIINTFVESYDFSGKTIVPFATSGGSGMGRTVEVLKALCPNANWEKGKMLNRVSDKELKDWLSQYEKS